MQKDLYILLLSVAILSFIAIIQHYTPNQNYSTPAQQQVQATTAEAADSAQPQTAQTPTTDADIQPQIVLTGALQHGESFSEALQRVLADEKRADELADKITQKLSRVVNLRKSKPGEAFALVMDYSGNLIRCTYEKNPFEVYTMELDEDEHNLTIAQEDITLERRIVKLSGDIDGSLFQAFAKLGERDKLTLAFADIFSSRIDFNNDLQRGDRFELLLEKYYKNGQFVGYGRILSAKFLGAKEKYSAYYFKPSNASKGNYYDETGKTLGTVFLKSPLPIFKLTSNFTMHRKHPVLGVDRPHQGIDLAAPIGTPVMAVADGVISFAGWKNGYGNTISIKHPGGYETQYAHLSKIADGIKTGVHVTQKQVIGRVGMTGIATGPHLDYRIAENGVMKNPLSVKFRSVFAMSGQELEHFHTQRLYLARLMETPEPQKLVLVETVTTKGPPDGWNG